MALSEIVGSYSDVWEDRSPAYKDVGKRNHAWSLIQNEMEEAFNKSYQGKVTVVFITVLTLHFVSIVFNGRPPTNFQELTRHIST